MTGKACFPSVLQTVMSSGVLRLLRVSVNQLRSSFRLTECQPRPWVSLTGLPNWAFLSPPLGDSDTEILNR